MAYEPKTWECGDVVTADALNKIEQGIADANELPSVTSADNGKVLGVDGGEYKLVEVDKPLIINVVKGASHTADKTFAEIRSYLDNGGANAIVKYDKSGGAGQAVYDLYLSEWGSESSPINFVGVVASNDATKVTGITVYKILFLSDGRIIVPAEKSVSLS